VREPNRVNAYNDNADIADTVQLFYVPTQTMTENRNMRTVKLVVIGNSGVGKTSLRGQVRDLLFTRDVAHHLTHSVRLWSVLGWISCNNWCRFHRKDGAPLLRLRRVSHSPNLGQSPIPSLRLHAIIAHSTL
jgi:hypothetical protein